MAELLKLLNEVSGPGTIVISGGALTVLVYIARMLRGFDQDITELKTKFTQHIRQGEVTKQQHDSMMTQVAVLVDRLERIPDRVADLERRVAVLETSIDSRLANIETKLGAKK